MKKLLVLVLILSLAPIAGAALQISVNGEKNPVDSTISIAMSDTITLDIWTNTAITAASTTTWALVVQPATAILTGGAYTGPLGTYYDPLYGADVDNFKGVIYNNIDGLIIPTGEQGCQGTITIWNSGEIMDPETGEPYDPPQYYPTIASGTVLFDNITLHCESWDADAVIHLYRMSNTTGAITSTQDTVIIHQIPEPATMILLCLGGLLLRKK